MPQSGECVILHMSRDQRVEDNYAMIYAQSLAISRNVPLKVVFHLAPQFLEMTMRHYHFMLTGLMEVEQDLRSKGIPLYLTMGDPTEEIPKFVKAQNALALVCDMSLSAALVPRQSRLQRELTRINPCRCQSFR